MTEQTDATKVGQFEPLRQSLRWHFACHTEEPDKSYASLGIANAETIVTRMLAAAEARGAERALREAADVVSGWDSGITSDGPGFTDWLRDRAARVAPSRVPGEGS